MAHQQNRQNEQQGQDNPQSPRNPQAQQQQASDPDRQQSPEVSQGVSHVNQRDEKDPTAPEDKP